MLHKQNRTYMFLSVYKNLNLVVPQQDKNLEMKLDQDNDQSHCETLCHGNRFNHVGLLYLAHEIYFQPFSLVSLPTGLKGSHLSNVLLHISRQKSV